jgi:hypothetical protein
MPRKNSTRSRRTNRLMDEVYRQMFLLEERRPGSELGLALALLRAWVAAESGREGGEEWAWLKKICPLCLEIIEGETGRNKLTPAQFQ